MINIENVTVSGWVEAVRGMRNPLNSWQKSDSSLQLIDITSAGPFDVPMAKMSDLEAVYYHIGKNDYKLMKKLAAAGPDHGKFLRMITVYMDITAPLYWWKEFDTYKVGTTTNSCSTMHTIADKEFKPEDFSIEHLMPEAKTALARTLDELNYCRSWYNQTKEKDYWWQMIQILPESYNQRRTVMLNYQVLKTMYAARKDHRLDEWRQFCKTVELLPVSELITGDRNEEKRSV